MSDYYEMSNSLRFPLTRLEIFSLVLYASIGRITIKESIGHAEEFIKYLDMKQSVKKRSDEEEAADHE